jgi:hypothetical protein
VRCSVASSFSPDMLAGIRTFGGRLHGHPPIHALAATRRWAINLLRWDKTCKRSLKGKLMRAAIDPDYLKRILSS